MHQRVTAVGQRRLGTADDHAGPVGLDDGQPLAEGVEQLAELLPLLDVLAQRRVHVHDAGAAGPHPARAPAHVAGAGRVDQVLGRLDHPQRGQHPEHPVDTGHDGPLVEAPRLTGFVEQHPGTGLARGRAQGAVAEPGVVDHRGTEGLRELTGARVLEVAPDLRQVGAAVRAGVQVDPDVALVDDLVHEQVGDPAGEGPTDRAREAAVEVAAVRHVAVAGHHAESVDDRDGDHGAPDAPGVQLGHHPSDDLDADDLVAVDRGVDPHGRSVLAAVQHVHRQAYLGAGDQPRDGQAHLAPGAGPHLDATDGEGRTQPAPARPRVGCHRCGTIRLDHPRPQFRRRSSRGGRPPT